MKTIFIIIALLVFSACKPRGETKSLSEVLNISQENFISANKDNLTTGIENQLKDITKNLELLLSSKKDQEIKSSSKTIAMILNKISVNAGYTSRPAIGELVNQYFNISKSESDLNSSAIKLLVARTYNLLSSELKSTSFRL